MSFKSGLVAVVGQPNVGKSTLVNAMVGQKVSIVSSKPQTTRRRVIGIANGPDYQVAFIDTPGIHEPHTKLGRTMVEQARASLADVDAILAVVDGSRRPDEWDKQIASMVRVAAGIETEANKGKQQSPSTPSVPIILCLNKMDLLKPEFVVQNTEEFSNLFCSSHWMMTTATKGDNVEKLLQMILEGIPNGEPMFPSDEFTDQSARFIVAEIVRERVLLATRQEVPHATATHVERWEEREDGSLEIDVEVVVEKASQRAILLGRQGRFIKQVGIDARAEIEALLDRHIYLNLHVVVREGWRQNPRMLRELEYSE